jgi:Gas vesicle protein K/Gas vesicle protein
VLDRLLDDGASVSGDAIIRLADVDLIHLELRLLLAGVRGSRDPSEAAAAVEGGDHADWDGEADAEQDRGQGELQRLGQPVGDLAGNQRAVDHRPARGSGQAPASPHRHPNAWLRGGSPDEHERPNETFSSRPGRAPQPRRSGDESLENGLGRLVVAIVELVRQLLERQAIRRMRTDSLEPSELDRLGEALQVLEARIAELREVFGVTPPEVDGALDTIEDFLGGSTAHRPRTASRGRVRKDL